MRRILAAMAALLLIQPAVSAQTLYHREELHKKAPSVPESIVFAGDTIRFDRQDMYERMDRELMSFTYMHTTSLLMLKRSVRYFTQVVPILRANGIPEDLKYMMVIESNLDPKALSSSGAAGLWQFTKATAQTYGLEVSSEVDERYNIEKETLAACTYLKKAYGMFGDWMTVAASYNAGTNGIAKRRTDQRQKSAFDLWMTEETSRYMYRILAAKMLFENPESFGFSVSPSEMYPYLAPKKVVTVDGPVSNLVDLAEENGVSYKALKEANLWLRDSKLTNKNGKSYSIIIPSSGR